MFDDILTDCHQHGIPRTAPAFPKTGEAREKELQKIQEYKDLVALARKKVLHATLEDKHIPNAVD